MGMFEQVYPKILLMREKKKEDNYTIFVKNEENIEVVYLS